MNNFLPPGKYFIGDPCYAIANDKWDDFVTVKYPDDSTDTSPECFVFQFEGHPVACVSTAHGDGSYGDQFGHSFGVDSGCIGAVPFALCTKRSEAELNQLGHVFTFTDEPSVRYEEDGGIICIGQFEIETDEDDEDDIDDDYLDEEDIDDSLEETAEL